MLNCKITRTSELDSFELMGEWSREMVERAMSKGYELVCNDNRLVMITPASQHITIGRAVK